MGLTGKTGAHRACNHRVNEHDDNVAVCCMQKQLGMLQGWHTRQMQMWAPQLCTHALHLQQAPEVPLLDVRRHAGMSLLWAYPQADMPQNRRRVCYSNVLSIQ